MKRILLTLPLTVGPHWAWSQSTIVHTDGPAFQIPEWFAPVTIDLDRDLSPEFGFIGSFPVCTTDIPISKCSLMFSVTALDTNALLVQTNYVVALSAGDWIGPQTATDDIRWGEGNVTLQTRWWSPRDGTSGSRGPLATLDEGFLGLRFSGEGGVHYGWARVRETTVLDWAYETRPGMPIRAGAKPVPVPLATPEVVRPGYLRLVALTEIGRAYQVQVKGSLDEFTWGTLGFVIPATSANTMVDLPIAESAQYFRVVEAD